VGGVPDRQPVVETVRAWCHFSELRITHNLPVSVQLVSARAGYPSTRDAGDALQGAYS
jgi:hypothetical protein